ncbi:MAG: hypothetical protein ACFFD1_00960 [Candidatus Thorarchaeota archaeon]
MKLVIEGDINESNLIDIGKFLSRMFRGKKEHINVFVEKGLKDKSIEETIKLLNEMLNFDNV